MPLFKKKKKPGVDGDSGGQPRSQSVINPGNGRKTSILRKVTMPKKSISVKEGKRQRDHADRKNSNKGTSGLSSVPTSGAHKNGSHQKHEPQKPKAGPVLEKTPPPRNATLLTLVESQAWPQLRHYLTDPSKLSETRAQAASPAGRNFVDQNVLHTLCSFHPPADLVKLLSDACPDLLSETDCVLRTPLHVGAMSGASKEVMEVLLSEHRAAAGMRDSLGMTPLCIACSKLGPAESSSGKDGTAKGPSSKEKGKGSGGKSGGAGKGKEERRPCRGVIKRLLLSHPIAVLMEDKSGRTPLEWALSVSAPEEIVRGLQRATRNVTQEMKARDALRHSTLKESVEEYNKSRCSIGVVPSSVEMGDGKDGKAIRGDMTESQVERRLSELSDGDYSDDSKSESGESDNSGNGSRQEGEGRKRSEETKGSDSDNKNIA